MSNFDSRLDRLERQFRPTCPKCGGWPIRVVIEDLDTGHTTENISRSGCSTCGTPIRQTVEIIGEAGDAGNGDDLAAKGA